MGYLEYAQSYFEAGQIIAVRELDLDSGRWTKQGLSLFPWSIMSVS